MLDIGIVALLQVFMVDFIATLVRCDNAVPDTGYWSRLSSPGTRLPREQVLLQLPLLNQAYVFFEKG